MCLRLSCNTSEADARHREEKAEVQSVFAGEFILMVCHKLNSKIPRGKVGNFCTNRETGERHKREGSGMCLRLN